MTTIAITFDNNQETVKKWLKARIAKELDQDPENIDSTLEFTSFGLDSIVLVTLSNDLAEWIGYDIDPTIFWEYENINHLSRGIITKPGSL